MPRRKSEKIFEIDPIILKTFDGYEYTTDKQIKIVKDNWFIIENPKNNEFANTIFLKSDMYGESQIILLLHKPSGTYTIFYHHYILEDYPVIQIMDPTEYKDKDIALKECYQYARRRKPFLREKKLYSKELIKYRKKLFNLQKHIR